MANEAAMVSVDSPDSDSDSEDYLANMAGMFTADRMSVLPCHVGTKLLLSVQYECVPCTSLRVGEGCDMMCLAHIDAQA